MNEEKKVLLIGADGQLGNDLKRVLKNAVPLTHQDIEICDTKGVKAVIDECNPEVVINTSAFHKVDLCEDSLEESFNVNAYAVKELAQTCKEKGTALVHISTDYVFDGTKTTPYSESDIPNPVNVYGKSKLAGENFIREILEEHFIIRTTGLYGTGGPGRTRSSFVELMLRLGGEEKPLKVVDDQILTPTYTKELAEHIAKLITTEEYGLFHITNNGECNWFEFAKEIFRLVGLNPDLSTTTTEAFGAKAKRPPYSVLENSSLKRLGMDNMSSWQDALKKYLIERDIIKKELNS